MHVVAILALEGVIPFDLGTATSVFTHVWLGDRRPAYDVRVCSPTKEVSAGAFRVRAPHGLRELARADTIVVPGIHDIEAEVSKAALRSVQRAASSGTRIASICTGAFPLAAAGLLDGLRATTHWMAAAELARRFPRVAVDPNVLFVDNGQVLTSAGAAAGLDLCLHMVRGDHGAAVAAAAARAAVMPLERAGGQAQFIVHPPPEADATPGGSLEPLLRWLERNASSEITLSDLARRSAMSTRTLSRRFREQTGTTPLQYLLQLRARKGQHLLETTDDPVEWVASKSGFGSATTFRACFQRVVGTSPTAGVPWARGRGGAMKRAGRSPPRPPF